MLLNLLNLIAPKKRLKIVCFNFVVESIVLN